MTIRGRAGPLLMAGMLGACGGGGVPDIVNDLIDSSPFVEREIAPLIEDYTRAADFASHPGHALSGIEEAYKRGYTGAGVAVVVVDDGVESLNSQLADRMLAGFNAFTDRLGGDPIVRNECDGFGNCDTGRHGTLVAGVIAAAADGIGAHGVAPGAQIFSLNVDTRANEGLLSGQEIANSLGFLAALSFGGRIFNHSYAVTYDTKEIEAFRAGAGGIYDNILTAFRAGAIHVYATGNDGADQPSMESLWPVWKPDLAGGILAVTGIVEDEVTGEVRLASYASKCGDAQEWCLSAPTGDFGANERFIGLVAPGPDGTYNTFVDSDQDGLQNAIGGTSTAAAYVSGALAVLKQAFPQLTGEELGRILLDTATDMGEAGTDAIYGRGALDMAEALSPQGTPTVATGATVASATTPLSATSLTVGSALAGAPLLRGKEMVFFDRYGRAFPMDASTLIAASAPYRDGLSRLDGTLGSLAPRATGIAGTDGALSFGVSSPAVTASALGAADANALMALVMRDKGGSARFANSDQFEGGFMGLSPDAAASVLRYALDSASSLSITMGSSRAVPGGSLDRGEDLATLDYAYTVDKDLALGLRAGLVREHDGMLGSRGGGMLALSDDSMTRFVEGRFVRRMGANTALIGEVGVGQTDASAATGYLDFDGPVTSVETRLGVMIGDVGRKGDRLTVSGGIPLHVVDGSATVRLPTGRDADGNVTYTTSRTSLRSGIPLEMRLDYAVPLTEKLTFGINSAVRRDGAADMYGDVAIGMRLKF